MPIMVRVIKYEKVKIVYSDQSREDFRDLYRCIVYNYKAPMTAFKYMNGLNQTIRSLETFPYANAVRTNSSLQQYGKNVRRVNYKKMAIIYIVLDDIVSILRIIPGNMIAGL